RGGVTGDGGRADVYGGERLHHPGASTRGAEHEAGGDGPRPGGGGRDNGDGDGDGEQCVGGGRGVVPAGDGGPAAGGGPDGGEDARGDIHAGADGCDVYGAGE